MTDLLTIIPDFPTKHYTHLLPSLERNLVTVADLLTLDALDLAKRARVPLIDVRRLKEHVLATLQRQLGLESDLSAKFDGHFEGASKPGTLSANGRELQNHSKVISTLDPRLDEALGGGIRTGYITELTGERYFHWSKRSSLLEADWTCSGAGKTQLLLSLLLSVQLSTPHGVESSSCYISTEHPLPTSRLHELLKSNPIILDRSTASDHPPSLSRILTLSTPDLESQEHILNFQLPIALQRHKVGLVVIDSIAANFRAERSTTDTSAAAIGAALSTRSTQLLRLGSLLQRLAREHNCAIVVSNQVADRFENSSNPQNTAVSSSAPVQSITTTTTAAAIAAHRIPAFSSSPATSSGTPTTGTSSEALHTRQAAPPTAAFTPLSLDHQQRFFTGWGDTRPPYSTYNQPESNLKTPSLGLVWANQIAARIALIKERAFLTTTTIPSSSSIDGRTDREVLAAPAEWAPRGWRRWMRVVFAPWVAGCEGGDPGVEFEIWAGGVRGLVEQKEAKKGQKD